MKAKAGLLRNDKRYKDLTIKDMVPIYAPPSDKNNVPGYTKDIGNFSGLDVIVAWIASVPRTISV